MATIALSPASDPNPAEIAHQRGAGGDGETAPSLLWGCGGLRQTPAG